jgi:hypothetical protein
MVPNCVFLEEIRHLKPVSELSQSDLPQTANIRKTNVIHYKRNRYEAQKGSYLPGRQARIETEENKVKFFGTKTWQLLAAHTIYDGFGKLVRLPLNAQRFKNEKREELKTAVLSGFDNSEPANIFVGEIIKKYPRYIRDQLSIILAQQKKYDGNGLFHALESCVEHELFSANDFRDTLEYFKTTVPAAPLKEIELPIKHRVVKAEIRDLQVYNSIAAGGNYS